MSIALRERRAIQGAEAIVRRDDGSVARLFIYATPLFDGETLIGGVNMLVELGERDRTNYLEQRLAAIVECSEDAIISKDLDGTIVTWNRAAEKLFGYTAAEAIGRPVMMLIPDDRQQEEEAILNSIRQGKPVARYETLRRRKDGTLVPIALTVSPLRDSDGRIIGASKVARDIADQIKIREHQMLVLNEMSHRVKNVLAVAGGLVGLSARSAQSPKAMAQAVQERLGAYSRAHELTRTSGAAVARGATRQTTLHTLIQAIVAPYLDETGQETNVSTEGEDITIDSNATASLALVLHEFTTNAAKYGALSTSTGRIRITSRALDGGFELFWVESGGPRVNGPPTRHGFGSVLATKTVEGQLSGTLHYDWRPDGLAITMTVPQERPDPA
jgi:PAS domain S-box-containing protein